MKSFYSTLAFGLGASAAALKRQAATCDCNFNIQVNGAQSGLLGSLADGQIRVGPGFTTPIDFCFNSAAGSITDNLGRGCIVAGAPQQYQCDNVQIPGATGITIDNGVISHNGSSVWYECLVDDNGNYNIYTADTGLATKCEKVQLTTAGNTTCGAPKVSTVSVVGPTMFSTIPASTVTAPAQVQTVTAPAASCPAASTVTLPAPAAQTSTVTLPAPAAQTVTQIQQSGASIVTVTSVSTAVSTVTSTMTAPVVTITSVSTLPASTVYVTSASVKTEVAVSSVPVTIVQTATETKATTAVSVQTSVATSVATSVQTTVQTQTAPASTVVISSKATSTVVPTTSSVVAPITSSAASSSTSTKVITSTVSSTSSAPTACGTPINGQYACPEQCPLDLTNTAFEYPHTLAINGVNGYFGEVSANKTTSFTFDIPAALQGKTCNTYFALPVKSQLVTADYTLTGTGSVSFSSAGKQVASFSPAAGNKYLVASGPCAAGQSVSYDMKATVGESLRWFQDWNACALGLFVVPQ